MKRRGFLGAIAALLASPAIAKLPVPKLPVPVASINPLFTGGMCIFDGVKIHNLRAIARKNLSDWHAEQLDKLIFQELRRGR